MIIWKQLNTIAHFEYGYTASAEPMGSHRFIRITDIGSDGKLKSESPMYISYPNVSDSMNLKAGDILLARTGGTFGKTMIFAESYPAVFASFLIKIIFDIEMDSDYFWLFAQSEFYWRQARALVTGGTQPQFNANAVGLIQVPITDLTQQKKIAIKLKKQMAAIDEILRDIDRQISDVDAFVERQINDMLCSAATSGWKEGLIEDFATVNPSVRDISIKPNDDDEVSFVPMSAVSAETGKITERIVKKYSEVRKGYTYFEEGDNLFAKITPCMQNGKIAIANDLVGKVGFGSTEFHVIRVGESITPEWLHYFFTRKQYLMEAAGKMKGAVGQQRLPDDFIRKTEIAFPSSLDEQSEIVRRLDKKIHAAVALKDNLKQQMNNIVALRKAYFREAFESEAQE